MNLIIAIRRCNQLYDYTYLLRWIALFVMYCNSNNCVIFVFKALKICSHKTNDYLMARNEGWLECNERYQNDPSINEEKWYPSIQLSSNAQNVLIAVEKISVASIPLVSFFSNSWVEWADYSHKIHKHNTSMKRHNVCSFTPCKIFLDSSRLVILSNKNIFWHWSLLTVLISFSRNQYLL